MDKYAVLVVASLLLSGCAGGGGSYHDSPPSVDSTKDYSVELELSVWGWGAKDVANRYRSVTMIYSVGKADPKELNMTFVSSAGGKGTWIATVPNDELVPGSRIIYEFRYVFDGRHQSHQTFSVPID